MSRLAVVIPLYNHEAYIGRALESVLAQSRRPERILVLDDGSPDGSVEAARRAAAGHPVEILTQENHGAHATLNRLVERASDCDLVAILNSDDAFAPERLERCERHLLDHPETSLVCTGLDLIGPDHQPLDHSEPRAKWFAAAWAPGAEDWSLPEWLGLANFPATTSNFVARRNWLAANPFKPYRYAHDYRALLVAAIEGVLSILPERLLQYRVHPGNTITTAPEKLIRELLVLHLDLARDLAPRLAESEALRARYAASQRIAWSNISAFRKDLFETLVALALETLPTVSWDSLFDRLPAASTPELSSLPNRPLANLHEQGLPIFGPTSGIAARVDAMKAERDALKAAARSAARARDLSHALAKSRWAAAGRLIGLFRPPDLSGAKSPDELAAFETILRSNPWLWLGARCGSKTIRRLTRYHP